MAENETTKFETTDIKKPKSRWRMGMNWKSLLTVFVILGIGMILLTTERGQKFAGEALSSITSGVGNFVSGLFSGDFDWSFDKMPSGEQFLISLSIAKESFYEQQYKVSNTSLDSTGICESSLKVGDVMLHKESMQCHVVAEDMKGTFEYTIAGTVKFEGDVSSLEVDGNSYTSDGSRLKTSLEMLPSDFKLDGLAERKVTITSATGSINRLGPEGSIKSAEDLDAEQLEISGFVGFIRLEGSNIKLQGLAVSVRGTGAHSSFSW
jgi:hypothetical protein